MHRPHGRQHARQHTRRQGSRPHAELLERRTLLSSAPATPGTDATVAGRHLFFNHSAYDALDPAANALDDFAVSPAVAPLLPGQSPALSNVSNYVRGINGVMVDVNHLAANAASGDPASGASISADDFAFRAGTTADPATWSAAPAPNSVTVRRGAGVNGSDRVTLTWPDGAIRNAWLQVTVLDTPDTGLAAPDVFYFASLPGDAGLAGTRPVDIIAGPDFSVTRRDLLATRRGLARRLPAGLASPLDHTRDGRVDARDIVVVRQNLTSRLERLQPPTLPPVYFVSPSGDDAGDGLDPLSAWRTVAKVNATPLAPGSRVLFQRGGEWHEQLAVSSSGTPEAPVVFGSYGTGQKPKFWGSDPLDASAFEPVEGTASTYRIVPAGSAAVNSVQANHQFLLGAFRPAGQSPDPAVNIAYVNAHADTWYQDPATRVLYVNTGSVDPREGTVHYTASVRNNIILVQSRHDVVLRNLVADETAQYHGGYAFAILNSDNVTVEGAEAYRAGKHHFGVINSGGFVGKDLYAAWAMPAQTFGEASAFVSYADWQFTDKDSTWVDCVYDELPRAAAPYLAFYTHGRGMGDLTIENMVSRGGIGISIDTEGRDQQVRVTGGEIVDGRLTLGGDGIFVDGMTIRGRRAGLGLVGSNNVVQNLTIDGAVPDFGDAGAVVNYGGGNTLRFSTIRVDPATPWPGAAIVLNTRVGTAPRFYGNIIDAARAFRIGSDPSAGFLSDHNLFAREPGFVMEDFSLIDLAAWREQWGQDVNSTVGDPLFADPAAGDFSLRENSPAADAFTATDLLEAIPTDALGRPRPQGPAHDLGPLERPA